MKFVSRGWRIGWPIRLILLVIVGCLLWGLFVEPDRLLLQEDEITIWQWGEAPLKAAVISDIHAGAPYIDAAKIKRIVQITNKAHPDIILLAGDFLVDRNMPGGRFMAPKEVAELLKTLSAPFGVYAVLGNHDWWQAPDDMMAALEEVGIRVLHNESIRIPFQGSSFWLMGLGDIHTGKQDISDAMKMVDDDRPIIALTHIPDIFATFPARIALGVAGHTHGGQVALPLLGPLVTNSEFGTRYAGGLIREEGQTFFVSRGTGTSVLPLRFGVTPEINILHIHGKVAN